MKYMSIIIPCVIAGVVLFIVGGILAARHRKVVLLDEADRWLVNEFRRCNVMVFGKKGTGKDLIFAHVIALRGEKHYANIPYDQNTEVIDLHELSAGDNTFEDFINGTVRPFEPRFEEGCDVYVSDAGVYVPNTSDRLLNEKYGSMPVLLALSRQLYLMNIHTNCQGFDRPWKKFREQADSYIKTKRTVRRGDCLYVEIFGYDKYSDAENEINPVVHYNVRIPIGELQYDTRHFREICFLREPTARERVMKKITRRVNYERPQRHS